MKLQYMTYDQPTVAALRAGAPDVYGNPAEVAISDGVAKPCRCCLQNVPAGAEMLICAARPFAGLHAYAETGPIFLCKDACAPHAADSLPPILATSPDYLVKAYDHAERIVYGTGQITPAGEVADYAKTLLAHDGIAHVDVRSAKNNCFLTRIVRSDDHRYQRSAAPCA